MEYTEAIIEDGKVRILSSKQIDPSRCPHFILVGDHYREDGSCKCDDAQHRQYMIDNWDYSQDDFDGIPLREREI